MNFFRFWVGVFSLSFFRLAFGGGGGSSSSSTSTTNIDRRIAVGDGGIGVSGDSNSIVVSDQGAISEAFKFATTANATNGHGFSRLLDETAGMYGGALKFASDSNSDFLTAATKIFNDGQGLIGQTQKSVADAYTVAQTTKQGTIDNKTMIVFAVAGVAALFAFNVKGGRA